MQRYYIIFNLWPSSQEKCVRMLEFALSSLLADDAAAAEGQNRGLTYKILLSAKQAQEARENTDGNVNSRDNGIG